jgi:hypothetical protein
MVYRAWSGEIDPSVDWKAMSERGRRLVAALARVGLAARGVTLGLIGGFLFLAAIHHRPTEAQGMAGAFRTVGYAPYGHATLAVLAVGFMANGFVELIRARYRRVPVSG